MIENHYMINSSFLYMTGLYDRHGYLCTLVKETERTVLVNKSPLDILDDSIRCIGFDLRGAMETSRWLLGMACMCPIMVNPTLEIVLFPTRSPKHVDNIWFNPNHIARTTCSNRQTLILFSNSTSLTLSTRLPSFNHKLQTAQQLKSITKQMAMQPFLLDPSKRKIRR